MAHESCYPTHIGDNWMIESDANGWETYSELPTQRFQHQYFDDTNLIKNMIFDLDVPTIGAIPGRSPRRGP